MSTRPIYSYQWAQSVVEAFLEKYARGAYFISRMAGISYQKLARYLIYLVSCDRQTKWEVMKRMIKRANRENFKDFATLDIEMRQKYLKYEKYDCENSVLDDLESGELDLTT